MPAMSPRRQDTAKAASGPLEGASPPVEAPAAGNAAAAQRAPKTVQEGDANRAATRVQDQLVVLGYLDEAKRESAGGVFDAKSRKALQRFQRDEGLTDHGEADAATLAALDARLVAQTRSSGLPPTLQKGDVSEHVTRLQGALQSLGLMFHQDFARKGGEFTGKTKEAVQVFQERNQLPVTGVVGPETWAALIAQVGPIVPEDVAVTGSPVLETGSKGPAVFELESLLASWGAPITPDEAFDKETRSAVKSFQAANGLTVDGRVNTATAAMLNSPAARPVALEITSAADIEALTFDQAVDIVASNGGDVFKEGEVTILAFRTANDVATTWEDYFVVLKRPSKIRVFEGVTRPGTFEFDPAEDQDPGMVVAGQYDLNPYTGSKFSQAFDIHDDDRYGVASVVQDQDQDTVLEEDEHKRVEDDPYIKLHPGSYGMPSSWGCFNVKEWAEFWDFVDGEQQNKMDMTVLDISSTFVRA
jgi:peptidoglycan hydrolase-like protein with peptidoglycan-binding domain